MRISNCTLFVNKKALTGKRLRLCAGISLICRGLLSYKIDSPKQDNQAP
jgi:hypothetical protein